MSWQNQNSTAAKSRKVSKIRKRRCSSSSSSSLVQKYRFKRAILVGKRGGSSTPVPTWKTLMSLKSPPSPLYSEMHNSEIPNKLAAAVSAHGGGGKGNNEEVSVSARKLAATLWEINKIPSPTLKEKKDLRNRDRILPQHLSDPSYSPVSEKMDGSKVNGHRRRRSAVSQKLQLVDYNLGPLDSVSNSSLMEGEALPGGKIRNECITGTKPIARLKDVRNSLTTSKELVKILSRICGNEEQNSSSISLITALRVELNRARAQIDHFIREQRSVNGGEIEYLMKHFAEEKAELKKKERERIREAIGHVSEELKVEKKLRRQTERLNKKLGKELAETKECLSKAMKELESEKRAKEILEQVCDELASGIGDDRAEFEELKRESVKVREEVEREREMLQLADLLREERVQMKLSEAKYQFEEKNAALERLRNELEAYLRSKKDEENDNMSPNIKRIKDLESYLKSIHPEPCEVGEMKENEEERGDKEGDDDEESGDSDLHSIELNVDNGSLSYNWSFAYDDKGVSFKGRKSIEKNIQWGSICLNRGNSSGKNWDLKTKNQDNSMEFDREKLEEFMSNTLSQDNRSIMSLRDHMLSGSKLSSLQSFASPTRQWGQSLPMEDPGNERRVSTGSTK